jgi:hypothetical protein
MPYQSTKAKTVQEYGCAPAQENLFGESIAPAAALANTHRRIGINGRGFTGGYFMQPGSGSKDHPGETCKTCEHYCRVAGGAKAYPKCGRMEHAWTSGPGSDIRARAAACSGWEKIKEDESNG